MTKVGSLKAFIKMIVIFMFSASSVLAEAVKKETVTGVSYQHILNWTMGLVIVLSLFFACIWIIRKSGALPGMNSKQQMKILTGLSLGMREKLVLVQIGEKQLVLGITPGRIDNLLMLEGDEQLYKETDNNQDKANFSEKLKQVMTGTEHE